MSPALANLMEKIDSRILRERVLIFLSLLAVCFLLWNYLVQVRFDRVRAALQTQQTEIVNERKALEAQVMSLTAALTVANDPVQAKQGEINTLTAEIAEIDGHLSQLSHGLISAEQLPNILEEVLLRTANVQLLQVRTLAATQLQLPNTAATNVTDEAGASDTGVYKHGVLIRVAGSYAELIQLMKEMENLKWKFYWDSLDYTVKQYPDAEVEIRVFTLSSEEGLFGV